MNNTTFGAILRTTFGNFRYILVSAPGVWLAACLLFVITDLARLHLIGPPQNGALLLGILGARLLGDVWIGSAIYRAAIRRKSPFWTLDAAFWRYLAAAVVLAVCVLALARGIQLGLAFGFNHLASTGLPLTQEYRTITMFAALLIVGLAMLRVSLWLPGLAVGDRIGPIMAWRQMRGATLKTVGVAIIAAVPIALAHYALTYWLIASVADEHEVLIVTAINGVISAVVMLTVLCTIAAAYSRTR